MMAELKADAKLIPERSKHDLVHYKGQKEIIRPFLLEKLEIGDEWFLVSSKWLSQWKKYTDYFNWDIGEEDDANPGPVDNADLFKNQTSDELKEDLMEYVDYSLIPKPAYDLLVSWYGLSRRSRHICRCVAEFGTYNKYLEVEIYLLEIKLCIHPNIKNIKSFLFSRANTIKKVQNKIIELFEVSSDTETRVWQNSVSIHNTYDLLSDVDQTLPDANINGGQLIMLEIKDEHGQWPCGDQQNIIMPVMSPHNASSSSSETNAAKFDEKNEATQQLERELKTKETKEVQSVVFESSIIRRTTFFKRFRTEFLALEDFGATLRSFKDDKKTSTTLDYTMTICTSVGPRTEEHDNAYAGWPVNFSMERCFVLNNLKNNLIYFVAETPELAKEWIEKLDEARKKHSTTKEDKKVAKENIVSIEEYQAQKESLDQINKEETEKTAGAVASEDIVHLVTGQPESNEKERKALERFNLQIEKQPPIHEYEKIPDILQQKETEGTKVSNIVDIQLTDYNNEQVENGASTSSSSHLPKFSQTMKYLVTERQQPRMSFESVKTLVTQQEAEASKVFHHVQKLLNDHQLMSAVESLEAENEEITEIYEEQINKLTGDKEELVREKKQLETKLTNKEALLLKKEKESATLEGEKVNLEGEKRKLEQEKETLEKNLEDEKAVMKREQTTLQDTLRDIQEKYHNLEIENQLLRDVRQELQEKNQQLQAEQKKNQILQGENKQLQDEKQQLQEKRQELQENVRVLTNSWKISHKDMKITKEELGRGGWGVIWVGQFRGQKVAVKQMYALILSEDNLQLLHREINTMSQLRHPNLLQFIGAVLDDPSGNPMIVTEIMDVSLRGAYEKKQLSPLPVHIPLAIMRDVAVGLNYLHCLPDPIIHRDVSSANVLLESKGPGKWKTKISDFGSAKFARSAVTKAAGAAAYSAPEAFQSVIHKKVQTPKMDSFSYGVLLWEVVNCRFPDGDVFDDLLQQLQIKFPSIHALITMCIKEAPHDRPTMKQVIDCIDDLRVH